jgi:uncharacterized membrane protein YoaT (DUF817 family)
MFKEVLSRWLPWIVLVLIAIVLFVNRRRLGLLAEFWRFMRVRKRWWLLPIIVSLILLGAFIVLVEALGPFMYAIF